VDGATGEAERALRAEGLAPQAWSNGPGVSYGRHRHEHHKVLVCASGSIVFHTDAGDVALAAGDRLELPAGTEHGATVGPDGVECVEAFRS
jgi:quercetin dioxygenase-like cupin family protein